MSIKKNKKAVDEPQSRKRYKKTRKSSSKNLHPSGKSEMAETRKAQKAKRKKERKMNKKPRRRIFPIWIRIIVVLTLCAIALIVGLMVGYAILGDGKPLDALKSETWQHIIDIVMKVE